MSLHNAMMNLPCDGLAKAIEAATVYEASAYKKGHRDARHAAAELALARDAEVKRLRDALACMEQDCAALEARNDTPPHIALWARERVAVARAALKEPQ